MKNDVIIRIGDKGKHVKEIQKALDKAGFWTYGTFTENFGEVTDTAVRNYQKANNLTIDGRVGKETLKLLGIYVEPTPVINSAHKYKDVIFKGSVFPDAPINSNERVRLNTEMVNEYLPIIEKMEITKGMRLLATVMAYKEGFRKGTRSYKNNNPGNIGNTDSGANKKLATLKEGIQLQINYINSVANGTHKSFPLGKLKTLKPYYSPEIAKHTKLYGMSPYLPGYEFIFTGQLDQFTKIYATGARAGNSYISMIVSFFKLHGINLNGQSKIQDIIKIQ
jgi:peptidoglycan hydrolase-like protein with peptidoglycan-binding domain